MDVETIDATELLEAWRDATRAAELAERLAAAALKSADGADRNAIATEEIASLAESAAEAAEHASRSARLAATRARDIATGLRDVDLREADEAAVSARALESSARDRYEAGRPLRSSDGNPEGGTAGA